MADTAPDRPDRTDRTDVPAWRRAGDLESHLWTSVAMVVVGLAHLFLPRSLAALRAPEVVGWTIVALAVVLYVAKVRFARRAGPALRRASLVLLGVVVVSNLVSLGLLVDDIVASGGLAARDLLLGGVIVWATNVAAFGFLFWELDRGGPLARAAGSHDRVAPDLLFPQMQDDEFRQTFRPQFVDYLYVAFTNALAFSPTDTMPLSRWTKILFAAESAVSFGTIALVAARAVNILPN